jgi:hypothetical protein
MISGFAQTLQSGRGVSAAGDVNSDGLDDVLVSAAYGYSNYYYGNSGGNFVVFGKTSGATVELESVTRGTGGFVIHGSNSYYYYYNNGQRVSGAGDINGDGLDDIVIGDPYDYSGYSYGGTTYVIFSPAPCRWQSACGTETLGSRLLQRKCMWSDPTRPWDFSSPLAA